MRAQVIQKINPAPAGLAAFLCICALAACGGGSGGGSAVAQPAAPTLAALVTLDDGTSVGAATFAKGATASGAQGQVVQGLACTKPVKSSAAYGYAHLNLVVDGQLVSLPEGIGQVGPGNAGIADLAFREIGCYYPLQTTDASGKIRTQPGNATRYTLGQFFALWGQPLGSTNTAGYAGKAVKAYIRDGGTLAEYTGRLDALPLAPNREITLQIGTAPGQIPHFEWTNPPPLSATPVVIYSNASDLASSGQAGLEGNRSNGKGGQGAPVDGLACYGPKNQTTFDYTYHVHSHLSIFKDGVRLAIPAYIGVVGDDDVPGTACDYPLHTHDTTGTVHVEAFGTAVTLGQFFNIWGQPLTRANVAGLTSTPVVVYVQDGGNVRKYQGDPAAIELKSYRSIVIQLGTPLAEIPTYDLATESE